MDMLNEFLKELASSANGELHIKPNMKPYVVSTNGNSDLSSSPLLGSQISMMVFPIIPPEVKQELPNKPSIEFVHSNTYGSFNFTIAKSSDGFNVTITQNGASQNEAVASADTFDNITASAEPSTESFPFESHNAALESPEIEPPKIESPSIEAQSFDDFVAKSTSVPLEDLVPAPVYQPPAKETVDEVLIDSACETPEFDRRSEPRNLSRNDAVSRLENLFKQMSEIGASDLHLSSTMPPMIRKDGKMQPLDSSEAISPEIMKELLASIMPERNRTEFAEKSDTDFAYEIPGLARFRCNIFKDRKGMGGVFRIIPSKMTTAEDLGLSQAILDLCKLSKGLVLVTGPTGSGKSTTLCAMVNHMNTSREEHIITIEDPIEFVHENIKCLVNQREVHNHTDSFKNALRAALREDPDIVLVGEMRDLETIAIAIETAETGHLVFGTLHTTTAPSTVDRIIDQFPADRQQQIRVMLSESLKGVISQTLLPKKGGGRVAALEVLIVTPAISNLIREGKTFQIGSAMQTGKALGMVLLNDALFDLVQKGLVEPRDAYLKAVDKTNFETMLNRGGFKLS